MDATFLLHQTSESITNILVSVWSWTDYSSVHLYMKSAQSQDFQRLFWVMIQQILEVLVSLKLMTCVCALTHACMCMYVCFCVCMHTRVCVCAYVCWGMNPDVRACTHANLMLFLSHLLLWYRISRWPGDHRVG